MTTENHDSNPIGISTSISPANHTSFPLLYAKLLGSFNLWCCDRNVLENTVNSMVADTWAWLWLCTINRPWSLVWSRLIRCSMVESCHTDQLLCSWNFKHNLHTYQLDNIGSRSCMRMYWYFSPLGMAAVPEYNIYVYYDIFWKSTGHKLDVTWMYCWCCSCWICPFVAASYSLFY